MSWVKVDDQFFRHPKAIAAGLPGRALFVAGLCYCAGHLTDGMIPKGTVPLLLAEAGVTKGVVAKLVDIGWWHDEGDTYRVHDYLDYNPSRADAEEARARKSRAGAKGAASRWGGDCDAEAMAGAIDDASQDDGNIPSPSPAATSGSAGAPAGGRSRGTRIPDSFHVDEAMQTWAETECPTVDWRFETQRFVDWAKSTSGRNAVKRDWSRAWKNWIRRAVTEVRRG